VCRIITSRSRRTVFSKFSKLTFCPTKILQASAAHTRFALTTRKPQRKNIGIMQLTFKTSRTLAAVMAIIMFASSACASEISRDDVILKNSPLALSKMRHDLHDSLTATPSTERRSLAESYLFCDMVTAGMKCGSHDMQATCNSDADCKWNSGECTTGDEWNEKLLMTWLRAWLESWDQL